MNKLYSKQYPVNSLLNPKFKYIPAAATDLKETFNRIREGMESARKRQEEEAKSSEGRVRKIRT